MDTSYLLMALRAYREAECNIPWQYQDALDWLISYVDANYDDIEELLDIERNARWA